MRPLANAAALFACLSCCCAHALATDIYVVGLLSEKALLVVNGAPPKIYSVGSAIGANAKLLAVSSTGATVEDNGKREFLAMGQYAAPSGGGASIVLTANAGGHFIARGRINNVNVQMMVDTGATTVSLPAAEARRLGIDYRRGQMVGLSTAGGRTAGYVVRLDSISVGDVELRSVEAVVLESGLSIILLGNSFLNQVEMHREGREMTLTQR